MSHANGQVKFNDGLILYYEYNGTSDVEISNLKDTKKEVHDNWRDHEDLTCNCGKDEPVIIACDFANGSWWKGRACRYCRAFTKGLGFGIENDEYVYKEFGGLPDWWVE